MKKSYAFAVIGVVIAASVLAAYQMLPTKPPQDDDKPVSGTDTWNPQAQESSYAYSPSTPQSSSPQALRAASEGIGFAAGGAKDIDNFRENIENDYLPLFTDVTYEGLFYDYYFDTGKKENCEDLFCQSYSYAVSKDPFSQKDEYYLSVGLNSGIKESNFERKKLNLVIVLDVSGSMSSEFDRYYYDNIGKPVPLGWEGDWQKTKIQLATESIVTLIDHLNNNDNLGVVLFNNGAHVAKPLESMESTDLSRLKSNILEIRADGGTNMDSGIGAATELFDDVVGFDENEYENRIIFLTDAMPNLGDTSEQGLFGMIKKNAEKNVYASFIGIGVDFNTELVEEITKIRGANYYSVHSAHDFTQRMDDEFEYMVTPLVFNLVLGIQTDGYKIKKVYGSPEANEATGQIMKVNTLFPSKVEDGKTRGGIILLKLEKISPDGNITLKTSYEDRAGRSDGNEVSVILDDVESDFFENNGIRKGVLLVRYAELMKTWAFEQRDAYAKEKPVPSPTVFYEEGIRVPPHIEFGLGKWERQSIPLQVSEEYKELFLDFNDYFDGEADKIGDDILDQESEIIEKLIKV